MNLSSESKIRNFIALLYRILLGTTGINLLRIVKNIRGIPAYIQDWQVYNHAQAEDSSFKISLSNLHPCLGDRYEEAGLARGDYFHQDLWIARKIYLANPNEHWDIGSRIDGFVAHLLTFRSVNVIDVRKLESPIEGLSFHQDDVTSLSFADNSIESLSCLHAMEHVGLGRYGDLVAPQGCFLGIKELQRVLAPGGRLYFSVPLGRERLEFNAHRVFDPLTILNAFSTLKLVDFAAIVEHGNLLCGVNPEDFRAVRYACGLFIFEKPETSLESDQASC
jgi:SAM-dependent methyltransferase